MSLFFLQHVDDVVVTSIIVAFAVRAVTFVTVVVLTIVTSIIVAATVPTGHNPGDLWWDQTNVQLKVYSGSAWIVIGPAVAATSPIVYDTISDNTNTAHQVARIVVDGVNVAVISSQTFTAKTTYAGLTNIISGLTVVSGQFNGNLTCLLYTSPSPRD